MKRRVWKTVAGVPGRHDIAFLSQYGQPQRLNLDIPTYVARIVRVAAAYSPPPPSEVAKAIKNHKARPPGVVVVSLLFEGESD